MTIQPLRLLAGLLALAVLAFAGFGPAATARAPSDPSPAALVKPPAHIPPRCGFDYSYAHTYKGADGADAEKRVREMPDECQNGRLMGSGQPWCEKGPTGLWTCQRMVICQAERPGCGPLPPYTASGQ